MDLPVEDEVRTKRTSPYGEVLVYAVARVVYGRSTRGLAMLTLSSFPARE